LIRFTLIDITTEKLAIKEHQESDKRFRQFAALLPQVICELDGNFNILYINDYGKQLFGLNKTSKNNLFDFLDNENKKMVADAFHQMVHAPISKDPGLQINFRNASDEIVTLFAYANLEIQDDQDQHHQGNWHRSVGAD
jgi:PAS domain-containing protein